MNKTTQHIVQTIASQPIDSLTNLKPLAVITELAGYLKTVQEETTKRAQIAAKRDVLLCAIDAEKTILLSYFALRFAERKAGLDQFFELLTRGVNEKDQQSVDRALVGILGILQDNPLKDLEEFKRLMAEGVVF